jgi:phosphate transport system permease protein
MSSNSPPVTGTPSVAAMDLSSGGLPKAARVKEFVIENILMLAGVSSVIITIGIVAVLLAETIPFFRTQVEQIAFHEFTAPGPYTVSNIVRQPGDAIDKRGTLFEVKAVDGTTFPIVSHYEGTVRSLNVSLGEVIDPAKFTTSDRILQASALESAAIGTRVPLAEIDWSVGFLEFFGDTQWTPAFADKRFGIWALISGTLVTTIVAVCVAVPVGTICAIWLSEYCHANVREIVKPILELLSAVPTVVYGYFALLAITPVLQMVLGAFGIDLPNFNMLSAGLIMGVMIIPYVASLSEDAMRSVPMQLREGSYAMGATRVQTALKVILPASFSGVTAAYILGIARAVGETMIVAIAAGQMPKFTGNPATEGQTITAFIVGIAKGDAERGSLEYRTIYVCGLVLLVMTLFFNIAGYLIRKRYREAY